MPVFKFIKFDGINQNSISDAGIFLFHFTAGTQNHPKTGGHMLLVSG